MNARNKALALAEGSRYQRELAQAQQRQSADASRSATLIDHDPVTGQDVFRTASGGTVRAGSLSTSGLPFGTQRNLLAGAGGAEMFYDEEPQLGGAAEASQNLPDPYSPLLTDGDPNTVAEDDGPIAPRGNPSDFAVDSETDALYYSKPGTPRAWVAIASPAEQIDVVIPDPEEGTILLVQHQAYRVRIEDLFVGGGVDSAETVPPVNSTVAVGEQISLNVTSVSSGAGNASIVLRRLAG